MAHVFILNPNEMFLFSSLSSAACKEKVSVFHHIQLESGMLCKPKQGRLLFFFLPPPPPLFALTGKHAFRRQQKEHQSLVFNLERCASSGAVTCCSECVRADGGSSTCRSSGLASLVGTAAAYTPAPLPGNDSLTLQRRGSASCRAPAPQPSYTRLLHVSFQAD